MCGREVRRAGGGQVPSAKGPPESPENAPRLGFLSAPVPWKKKKKTERFLFFIYLFNLFAASWTSAWLGTARPGTLMLLSASLLPPVGAPLPPPEWKSSGRVPGGIHFSTLIASIIDANERMCDYFRQGF